MDITVKEAIEKLSAGEVIAIPTDTVYGIAAPLSNPEAIEKIFAVKGRPDNNPLLTLVPGPQAIYPLVKKLPPAFERLVEEFWPGALTLVFDVDTEKVPDVVRRGLPTAGFRQPAHPMTQEILESVGPIVATSANISGKAPATDAAGVEENLGKDFPVVDGGASIDGLPSTIIGCYDGKWKVLREGSVRQQELGRFLG